MTQINPYLTFNGNCREAMNFYKDCFGGQLTLQTIGDSPMAEQMPVKMRGSILHASLVNKGLTLFASDAIGLEGLVRGNEVSLSLVCDTGEEILRYFSQLSTEGKVIHPLHDFFGGTLGTLIDKFGKNWLLYHDSTKTKKQKH